MAPEATLTHHLQAAVDRVVCEAGVECVALFGSAVAQRLGPGSDIDLYVRLLPGRRWSLAQRLAMTADLSHAIGREVDLVVEDETTSVILRREVAVRGRVLFEARAGAWTDLRASAMLAYADLEPFLRLIGDAVRARARAAGGRRGQGSSGHG